MLPNVTATPGERRRPTPGDDIVPRPDIVMDRGFDLPAPPPEVWPWIVQLGRSRSGWYLPRRLERLLPPGRRALRQVDPALQTLSAGDVIPDYGGRDETFEVAVVEPPFLLVHRSVRGHMHVSWAITLIGHDDNRTRVHLRLRLGPVHRKRLVRTGGELLDRLTIALLAAGLRERVSA